MKSFCISPATLSRLMPMHLILAKDGKIDQFGPTAAKLHPDGKLSGLSFFDFFDVRRPVNTKCVAHILTTNGAKLHLITRDERQIALKAVAMPFEGHQGVLLNLSFGISVVDAIHAYDLNIGDFAATDLAVEMLYLLEAKSAAMSESRKLNTRLQGAKIAAEEQAYTDVLTGLKNRRAMNHVLSRFIEAGEDFGLMQVDLDYFKNVNDTLGHAAGDFVLLEVAKILTDETRDEDLVARVGGDEFVLIFHRLTDITRLNEIANRIINRMELPIPFDGLSCRISASIGTTVSNYYNSPKVDDMLKDADLALYASKHKGRACSTMFTADLARSSSLSTSLNEKGNALTDD